MFRPNKATLERFRDIDRGFGRYAERLSRIFWPWREQWLLLVIGALPVLDFTSTYILLKLSGRNDVYESGLLAIWALNRGGFTFLFLVDLIAAVVLTSARVYRPESLFQTWTQRLWAGGVCVLARTLYHYNDFRYCE